MRIIGRLAFPIFAFLIAEGFYHTRNVEKYLIRLFIFAFISEIPFDLVFHQKILELSYQNVFFTLALGLLAIYLFDKYKEINRLLAYMYLFLFSFFSILINSDYHVYGVLMVFCFYYFRGDFFRILISIFSINLIIILPYLMQDAVDFISIIQIFAVLSLVFVYFYNHKKGYPLKYIFYLFYPVHLLIIYFLNK